MTPIGCISRSLLGITQLSVGIQIDSKLGGTLPQVLKRILCHQSGGIRLEKTKESGVTHPHDWSIRVPLQS